MNANMYCGYLFTWRDTIDLEFLYTRTQRPREALKKLISVY
jgi:hypothetical protein